MLLSQELNYEGDIDEFVLQIARHRTLRQITFCDFVDIYNSLIDRVKLQRVMSKSHTPCGSEACSSSTSSGAGCSSQISSLVNARAQTMRRNVSGSAYLVSGAALTAVNGSATTFGSATIFHSRLCFRNSLGFRIRLCCRNRVCFRNHGPTVSPWNNSPKGSQKE